MPIVLDRTDTSNPILHSSPDDWRLAAKAILSTVCRTDRFCANTPGIGWRAQRRELTVETYLSAHAVNNPRKPTVVGAYLIDSDDRLNRVVFDIDDHGRGQEHVGTTRFALQEALSRHKVSYTIARSKSGEGFHLTVLFDRVPAKKARRIAFFLLKEADTPDVEIYPKQDVLAGAWGNQVALPYSRFAIEENDGSYFVDPQTLAPVHLSEVPSLIASVHRYTESEVELASISFRIDLDSEDPTAKKRRQESTGNRPAFVGTGAREEDVERLLTHAGLSWAGPRANGAGGIKWLLDRCPNSDSHSNQKPGTAGVGGAAVFLLDNGRLGFKCHHEHCITLGWRDFREMVDPNKLVPLGRRADRKLRKKWNKRLTPRERDFAKNIGFRFRLSDFDSEKRWLATNRLCRQFAHTATCMRSFVEKDCTEHGRRRVVYRPCGNHLLCIRCATRHAMGIKEEVLGWAGNQFAVYRYSGKDYGEMKAERKRLLRLLRNDSVKPRWVDGANTGLLIWSGEDAGYATDNLDNVKLMSRRNVASAVYEAWIAPVHLIRSIFKAAVEADDPFLLLPLLDLPWLASPHTRRTAAGRVSRDKLPWFNASQARKEAREAELEKRGGVPLDQCAAVVERDEAGKPTRRCCLPLQERLVHLDGTELAERLGGPIRGPEQSSLVCEHESRNPAAHNLELE